MKNQMNQSAEIMVTRLIGKSPGKCKLETELVILNDRASTSFCARARYANQITWKIITYCTKFDILNKTPIWSPAYRDGLKNLKGGIKRGQVEMITKIIMVIGILTIEVILFLLIKLNLTEKQHW